MARFLAHQFFPALLSSKPEMPTSHHGTHIVHVVKMKQVTWEKLTFMYICTCTCTYVRNGIVLLPAFHSHFGGAKGTNEVVAITVEDSGSFTVRWNLTGVATLCGRTVTTFSGG